MSSAGASRPIDPDLVDRLVLIDCSGLPRSFDQFLSEEVKMREWSVARLGYLLNSEDRWPSPSTLTSTVRPTRTASARCSSASRTGRTEGR